MFSTIHHRLVTTIFALAGIHCQPLVKVQVRVQLPLPTPTPPPPSSSTPSSAFPHPQWCPELLHSVDSGCCTSTATLPFNDNGFFSDTSLSLVENLGHLTWVRCSSHKVQQPQERCYPFLSVCAAFSCVQTMAWEPVLGISNVHADVDVCDNTQGLYALYPWIYAVHNLCQPQHQVILPPFPAPAPPPPPSWGGGTSCKHKEVILWKQWILKVISALHQAVSVLFALHLHSRVSSEKSVLPVPFHFVPFINVVLKRLFFSVESCHVFASSFPRCFCFSFHLGFYTVFFLLLLCNIHVFFIPKWMQGL